MKKRSTDKHATNTRKGRIANIEPFLWKPGQSGNPAGRPKGVKFLSEALRDALSTAAPDGVPWVEKVAMALIERACIGDPTAFREIADRIEGRVSAKLEVQPADGEFTIERLILEAQERRAAKRAQDARLLVPAEGSDQR